MANELTNYFEEGYTPLHFAADNGYEGFVDLLLKEGASVNAIAEGRTPLHFAAARGHANITKSLLKHGADVNCMCKANSSDGESPLHLAVRKSHVSVARILLECGANVDAQNKSGHTILHEAVSVAKTSMVELVLEYCPDVNNESNRSSLNLALNGSLIVSEYREIVELLLQKGFNIRDEADVNAVSRYCKSSIHAAALNGYVTVLEALLEYGESANSEDENGQTPLYAAANKGNLQVIETLVKYGADIDSRDQSGRTALHIASWVGHASIVRGLLDYGSDINIVDSCYRTALDFSKTGKYLPNILKRLHGIDYEIDHDSLCFQDDYDDDDGLNPFEYRHGILEYHIIKLKTANLPVSHKNLRSIKYNQTMQDFEDECKNEFETLRQTFVGNTKHSFHHLLTKSDHHLAIILEDDNFSRCITPDHVKENFPLYGSIICGRLTIAKHRRKILDETSACVFQIFPRLNWDCIQKIITYLSNGDLMNVMHACKRKPAAL
ncbi:serine/threonine-protein phosphatase 6 regulatory ankyrin repeat subunit B-like [Ischnura elegans]|uniref:serine/threonine-protein phosphatase 6 regulatory ankyrin repeat subunit B-like n=1 Tax=Ischnura elegans TaxID=197161 RepID=UPI001ED88789|nr:serine/threonine-protein phosphatase 6 regulatory ankyrin repeat subunit B-like [Ischnura elegans]